MTALVVIWFILIYEMDAGPDWEPVRIMNNFCDAGVHVGLGYGTYSVTGGLGYNACKRVLYSL